MGLIKTTIQHEFTAYDLIHSTATIDGNFLLSIAEQVKATRVRALTMLETYPAMLLGGFFSPSQDFETTQRWLWKIADDMGINYTTMWVRRFVPIIGSYSPLTAEIAAESMRTLLSGMLANSTYMITELEFYSLAYESIDNLETKLTLLDLAKSIWSFPRFAHSPTTREAIEEAVRRSTQW